MKLVKTNSFELAVYTQGDSNSDKLALVLPGKLDTKDYAHMRSHVDALAARGYFAVSFDPPGTWESSGNISLYTTTNYLKAVDEVVDYYGNKPTFVIGHSRGGTIATIAGTRNNKVFGYAAIMSSFAKDGFGETKRKEWEEKGVMVSMRDLPPGGGAKEKRFELPYSFFEDQIPYNLTGDITTSTKHKLFILGKNDSLVSPDRIKQTFDALADPKELYELDSGHDYRKYPVLIEKVNSILSDFLKRFE